jgi:transcriptional regulator with XRE-family HTH domain
MKIPRLREWREARGLRQKDVGEAASVSEWTVLRAEGGKSVQPYIARRIADSLGVSVADLLENPPVPLGEAQSPSEADEEAGTVAALTELSPGVRSTAYERQRVRDPEAFFKMARELDEEMAKLRRNIEALDVPAEDLKPINENLESLETRARELVDQVA